MSKVANFCEGIYRHRWDRAELEKVNKVWEVLVKNFFQALIGENSKVLDIGCGFCHFLNHLQAREKVGVDANPVADRYASNDVIFHFTDDLSLKTLQSCYFDCVFISNFLEHMESSTQVLHLLRRVKELLVPNGRLIILQPNFRLVGAAYFDFIDHKTVLTDKSLEEALQIAGFDIQKKIIRFLPYTTKSKIPRHPALVRFYLWFRPLWLIMGKQSLFVATAKNNTVEKHSPRPSS
ncbi:MAG TPA: methyltransferase domain-containing protein [Candidatus Binatia bacterium]|nr:methyltransferase domain-containing protein [Candidatus Binatia bacterium]